MNTPLESPRHEDAPAPVAHDIDLTKNGISIDGTLLTEMTVANLTSLLGEPRVVLPESFEPNKYGTIPNVLFIWDAAGVLAYSKDQIKVTSLKLNLANDAEWESRVTYDIWEKEPRNILTGTFTIEGNAPIEAIPEDELRKATVLADVDLSDEWGCGFMVTSEARAKYKDIDLRERMAAVDSGEIAEHLRAQEVPFRDVSISHSPKKEAHVSSGKWLHQPTSAPVLVFNTPEFAYAVIQDLMYDQELLTPKFNVYDFADDQAEETFDPRTNDGTIIPAARTWFKELPVPAELAAKVETLYLDGGNDIYLQLAPLWDGEDEQFSIEEITDSELAQFPNLKKVEDIGGFLSPEARDKLEATGITVTD